MNASIDDVALANSASYGLHLVANGLPWHDGDEVLLMRGDFPSCILPWLGLRQRGVSARFIDPAATVITVDEVAAAITPRTRVLCVTWVHSLSGYTIDLEAIGALCRDKGVLFFVNASQALGTRSLDVSRAPIDALTSVGFKWLCGPYGTGVLWLHPAVRDRLQTNQCYWLASLSSEDLGKADLDLTPIRGLGARRFDIFGTANFFNFHPWCVALDYLLTIGIAQVAEHNTRLVDRFIAGLPRDRYRLLSPETGPARSTLIYISHKDETRNRALHRTLQQQQIYSSYRSGSLRFSPHLYLGPSHIDRVLESLKALG